MVHAATGSAACQDSDTVVSYRESVRSETQEYTGTAILLMTRFTF